MRPCFAFSNIQAADNKPAVLSIYDEIGFFGTNAKDFIADLGKVQGSTLNVEINSPGGDVFAGLAIYNALKLSGKEIVVKVMGVAASAASLIAMAGDKIVMPKNTFMMIHNPWSFAMGNADELREQADTLDKIGSSLLATYAARTGKSEDEIAPLLAKDTWLTADEALELGFATEVVEDVKAKASFDMARADLPENVKAVFVAAKETAPEPAPAPVAADTAPEADPGDETVATLAEQIEAYARTADFLDYAPLWAVACTSMEEVQARAKEAREIRALCALVKKPESADAMIRNGQTLAQARAELIDAMAKVDEDTHTNANPKNKQATGSGGVAPVSSTSLWQAHNNARK